MLGKLLFLSALSFYCKKGFAKATNLFKELATAMAAIRGIPGKSSGEISSRRPQPVRSKHLHRLGTVY
jgi:hypothetical protein